MTDRPEVRVRPMEHHDVAAVADVHMTAFPDYFLTHMGRGFLEKYYDSYVGVRGAYAFLASVGPDVVGFLVGALDENALTKAFYRRHWPVLGATVVWKFVTRRAARASIVSRAGVMREALVALVSPRSSTDAPPAPPAGVPEGAKASLMSIGVDPAHRGRGIAEKLQDAFAASARRDGATWLRLNVRPDNARAVGFYEKSGWRVLRSTDKKTTFFREV
jgi:ribosomal protein S18 acetylase RimI-like enzyme